MPGMAIQVDILSTAGLSPPVRMTGSESWRPGLHNVDLVERRGHPEKVGRRGRELRAAVMGPILGATHVEGVTRFLRRGRTLA